MFLGLWSSGHFVLSMVRLVWNKRIMENLIWKWVFNQTILSVVQMALPAVLRCPWSCSWGGGVGTYCAMIHNVPGEI